MGGRDGRLWGINLKGEKKKSRIEETERNESQRRKEYCKAQLWCRIVMDTEEKW